MARRARDLLAAAAVLTGVAACTGEAPRPVAEPSAPSSSITLTVTGRPSPGPTRRQFSGRTPTTTSPDIAFAAAGSTGIV
ncbi:MAG: hypothetical protein ACLGH4_10305 [Actinomycetes bacterium]